MNIEKFTEPESEQSAVCARPRSLCTSNKQYRKRKRVATREFRAYFIERFGHLSYQRGWMHMAPYHQDTMQAYMEPAAWRARLSRKDKALSMDTLPATYAACDFVDEIRSGRCRDTPNAYHAWEYESVMNGVMSLACWADARRTRDWKSGTRKIKPSNSRRRLRCYVRTSKDFDSCGLSRPDSKKAAKYWSSNSRGRVHVADDIACVLTVCSDWKSQWVTSRHHHNPDRHLVVAGIEDKHMYGRKCSRVKYVKSGQGCHYTNAEGFVALFDGEFVIGTTRRNLEQRYIKKIATVLIEQKLSHISKGLEDEDGKLDKMTRGSLRQGMEAHAITIFHEGCSNSVEVSTAFDTLREGK